MIHPRKQWAQQIDVTNVCWLSCSNCTRLIGHAKRYYMGLETFGKILESVRLFPLESEPCPRGRRKVVGLLGGEPLLHPEFPAIVDMMVRAIPDARHRGLWTSLDWPYFIHPIYGAACGHVARLLEIDDCRPTGYLNWNRHGHPIKPNEWNLQPADKGKCSEHQPMLVASEDVVADEKRRWKLVEDCWVQRQWSGTYTPAGYFPCEVMGHLNIVFDGPGGLPVNGDEWRGDMEWEDRDGLRQPVGVYASLIERWCRWCGGCLPMAGRLDKEQTDDVSPGNMLRLPSGKRKVCVVTQLSKPGKWQPNRYLK